MIRLKKKVTKTKTKKARTIPTTKKVSTGTHWRNRPNAKIASVRVVTRTVGAPKSVPDTEQSK